MDCGVIKTGKIHCSDKANILLWLEKCSHCEEYKKKASTPSVPVRMNILGRVGMDCYGRMFLGGDEI